MSDLVNASKNGDLARVQKLIGEGADVDKDHAWGDTPLLWASRNGHLEVVRVLLDANAKVGKANWHS